MEFCNVLDDFFLLQKNLHVTRDTSNSGSHGNILDLVLTNDEFLVEDILVHPNAFPSEHHPLTFKLHVKKTRPRNAQRLCNDPDKNYSIFYCSAAIRFPHVETVVFSDQEFLN